MTNDSPNLLIEARDVHKTYTLRHKEVRVLCGASLDVKAGESVAVIGRSGAGKSTLLHILGGLDRPDEGRIVMAGRDLYGISAAERTRIRATRVGFVFQSYHLLPEMDVFENVYLPAMAVGRVQTPRRDVRQRALDLLGAVGLADRANHTPMELSGGEQQRVALARALMNDPQLILADEPTGNLDSETGDQVLKTLLSLTRGRGHTLVIVTHDERIAQACDRVLMLAEGGLSAHEP